MTVTSNRRKFVNSPELPVQGSCRCGKIGLKISAPPLMTAACHCMGCQRMSASAYSLTAMIPSGGFSITKGEPVLGGLRSPHQHHYFCLHCLTWMFTRIDGVDDFVNVRPTMFEDASWFSPFIETMIKEKLAWATVPAPHSFKEFPPMAEYQGLMAEFSAKQ